MDNEVVEAPLKINAFDQMKKILLSEMKAQGLTSEDIRKVIRNKKNCICQTE